MPDIRSSMSASAPRPMAANATTEATPMTTPRSVRLVRIGFDLMDANADRIASAIGDQYRRPAETCLIGLRSAGPFVEGCGSRLSGFEQATSAYGEAIFRVPSLRILPSAISIVRSA